MTRYDCKYRSISRNNAALELLFWVIYYYFNFIPAISGTSKKRKKGYQVMYVLQRRIYM